MHLAASTNPEFFWKHSAKLPQHHPLFESNHSTMSQAVSSFDEKISMIIAIDQGDTTSIRLLQLKGVHIPKDTFSVLLGNTHLQAIRDLVNMGLLRPKLRHIEAVNDVVSADDFRGNVDAMFACGAFLREHIQVRTQPEFMTMPTPMAMAMPVPVPTPVPKPKCLTVKHTQATLNALVYAGTCVLCHVKPATQGFLHGITIHECACASCADAFMATPDCSESCRLCPLCSAPVEAAFAI